MINLMTTRGMSALTAPLIPITWLLLLSSSAFLGIPTGALPLSSRIEPIAPEAANPLRLIDFLEGMVLGISQGFVKGNGIAALFILIGLAIDSIVAAGYARVAALISVIVAHLLGAESQIITAGLVGFNPIPTAIAVGIVFNRTG